MPGALFLDRDGVLNEKAPDGAYVTDPASFRLLPGVPAALAALRAELPGLRIVVVTNQRGIARGVVRPAAVETIHAGMRETLGAAGGDVDAVEVCPHEAGACDCRKPGLGLFRRALLSFPEIEPGASAMVGDSASDMEAGTALGARTYLVGPQRRREAMRTLAATRGARVDEEAESLPALVHDGRLQDWLRARPSPANGSRSWPRREVVA